MSLNINTITNKSEFTNFFSEPLTIPKNAEIVMTKANIGIPITISHGVPVPALAAYNEAACVVVIDGIREEITWQDIYDAHVATTTANFSLDRVIAGDEGTYFGEYEFRPNDRILISCINEGAAVGTPESVKTKISFNRVLADAITAKFEFYEVESATIYSDTNTIEYPTIRGEVLTPLEDNLGAAISGTIEDYSNQKMTHFGFNVRYDPVSVSKSTATNMVWNAGDSLINWNRGGADQITSTNAGVNVAFASENASNFSIDPNGGWVGAIPTLITGKMAWGLSLVAPGGGEKFDPNFLGGGGTTCDDYLNLIDIGFLYSNNAAGSDIVQIIDGKTNNSNYDGAGSVNPQIPTLQPPHLVNEWTTGGGEKHFIHIKRGSEYVNGSSEFIFTLFGGTTGILEDADRVLYVCKRKFSGGLWKPTLVALSDNIAGNDLNEWRYIPLTADSQQQGYYLDNNYNGDSAMGVFAIEPKYGNAALDQEDYGRIRNFWKSWGLNNTSNAVGNSVYFESFKGNDLNRVFRIPTQLDSFNTQYIIGEDDVSKFFKTHIEYFEIMGNSVVYELPPQLSVSIDNLDTKNFEGTLLGGVNPTTGEQVGKRNPVTRVVGTIPLPINDINTSDFYLLQYEPFNLIYRPINNSNPFTLNQLNIRIFYFEFLTNIIQKIPDLYGVGNLEFNIKQGYTPKKPSNGLLPY